MMRWVGSYAAGTTAAIDRSRWMSYPTRQQIEVIVSDLVSESGLPSSSTLKFLMTVTCFSWIQSGEQLFPT